MKLVRSSVSIDCGLPCEKVRSAPATVFSRPAQRLLTLWPARSPSRHATLYIESSDSFVASAAAKSRPTWRPPLFDLRFGCVWDVRSTFPWSFFTFLLLGGFRH